MANQMTLIQSLRRMLSEHFPASNVTIGVNGNVLATVAFLHGLASGELTEAELNSVDRDFELLLTVRAVKAAPQA